MAGVKSKESTSKIEPRVEKPKLDRQTSVQVDVGKESGEGQKPTTGKPGPDD